MPSAGARDFGSESTPSSHAAPQCSDLLYPSGTVVAAGAAFLRAGPLGLHWIENRSPDVLGNSDAARGAVSRKHIDCDVTSAGNTANGEGVVSGRGRGAACVP